MLKKLWLDEGGAIISAELVLVMVILVIGMIVGLVCLRDAVVAELADLADALGSINMSYAFTGVSLSGAGPDGSQADSVTFTAGSQYTDNVASLGAGGGGPWQGLRLSDEGMILSPVIGDISTPYTY